MAIFEGAGVALVTPMNENLEVNYDKLEELLEEQIPGGTDAIVICGTTGESATLTEEEHMRTIKFAIDKVNHRIPVVAGTGSNSTATATQMSKEAAEAGAGHPPVIRQVVGKKETRLAKSVIIASGAHHRKLGIPGEAELTGKGVSYCATCDGAFFRKKTTAVIGGGDVALEDAIFLARLCEKVYVIHRRDEFRGAKSLQKRLMELPNVEILWDTVPEEICGAEKVETLKLLNKKTGEKRELAVDGVFVAVGITPNSEEFKGSVDMDPAGYIVAGEAGKTNVPGIFAAGDVRTKALRQIVTAVADGANCVASVEQYLYSIE